MSENTTIEWCDSTFNPWIGCTRVSPACDDCYAARSTPARTMAIAWGPGQERRRTRASTWEVPERWNSAHAEFFSKHGRRRRVFCASLADVFDNEVPPEWRVDLFRLIEATPNLDWLLLTKRIGIAKEMMFLARGGHLPLPPNIWLGATVVNQAEADRDIPKLLAVPARVRFLSIEPMLGPIDLAGLWSRQTGQKAIGGPIPRDYYSFLHQVIVGGESGPRARPMHPDWARSLRDQCAAAGVAFHFKQWGEWCPCGPESLGYRSVDGVPRFRMTDAGGNGQDLGAEGGNDVWINRAGKKAAGRLLDGVEHNGFPS